MSAPRVVIVMLTLAACDDALDQRLAIIREPRVLAVVAEPAESKPGSIVDYRALVGSPGGPFDSAPRWSFCTTPKPPTEDNVVSVGCVDGIDLIDIGRANTVTGVLPSDGCLLFGPDTPPGGFRPRDADPTGGYYQPVRVDVDQHVAVGLSRITCNLPGATPDIARRYMTEYVANRNPTLNPIALASVPADSDVTLEASWPADSAESFLYYDQLAQRLVDRRESMRVSWFATGGSITVDASAVDEDDFTTSVSTTWHTPATGTAHLWFVLRDSRGGIATESIALTVE